MFLCFQKYWKIIIVFFLCCRQIYKIRRRRSAVNQFRFLLFIWKTITNNSNNQRHYSNNPYHNFRHACDVTQVSRYFVDFRFFVVSCKLKMPFLFHRPSTRYLQRKKENERRKKKQTHFYIYFDNQLGSKAQQCWRTSTCLACYW